MNKYIQTILAGKPLNEDGRKRLQVGFIDFYKTEEALHKCLGLAKADDRRILRNSYIVKAWQLMTENHSPWNACIELSRELKRFHSIVWPAYKNKTVPDESWSKLRVNLFWVCWYSVDKDTPGNKQISNIVKSAGVYLSQNLNDS